ncbi:MAG: M48 family metallopeptidase [Firmicutes bacterium]|nr:M48 family metallopeptidase [Bacillota bacterium]
MANLRVDDLEIEVIRKKVRHIYISLLPPAGNVRMTVPAHLDHEMILSFARAKLDWIKRQQAKILARPLPPVPDYINGETHYFFGHPYELQVLETTGRPRVELNAGQSIILFVRPQSTKEERQKLLYAWYRRQLQAVIPGYLQKWQEVIGVTVKEWGVKRMKTKWGSCNIQARRIWLNLELVKKSPHCLEYIIVHELIHLLERYHNRRFYAYLTQYLPGWKEIKKELNSWF